MCCSIETLLFLEHTMAYCVCIGKFLRMGYYSKPVLYYLKMFSQMAQGTPTLGYLE